MSILVIGGTGTVGSATVRRLLGHPPRCFEDFVRETAAAWKS